MKQVALIVFLFIVGFSVNGFGQTIITCDKIRRFEAKEIEPIIPAIKKAPVHHNSMDRFTICIFACSEYGKYTSDHVIIVLPEASHISEAVLDNSEGSAWQGSGYVLLPTNIIKSIDRLLIYPTMHTVGFDFPDHTRGTLDIPIHKPANEE